MRRLCSQAPRTSGGQGAPKAAQGLGSKQVGVMVCHVSPDGMAVQTPDDRNAGPAPPPGQPACVSPFLHADRVVPTGLGGLPPAAAGVRAQVSALWTRLGWSGPRPATRPRPLPGCTLGPGTCPPWTLGSSPLWTLGRPRAPPVCLQVLAVPPEPSLRAVQHSPGMHAYILESQGWAPGKLDPQVASNELGLYPGCLWKPSPRKGSGGSRIRQKLFSGAQAQGSPVQPGRGL